MTREEAIHRIKDHMVHHGIGRFPHILLAEAMKMAIAALREQEERSKGCEYCNEPSPHRDCIIGDVEQMLVSEPDGSFLGRPPFIHYRKVKFCPMCGRKLEAEE